MATVELLGTGGAHGVPLIGCDCNCCQSTDPRDKRMRPSAFIRLPSGFTILIDCGPEFRAQALRANIADVNFVLLTHSCADHIFGIDDLRAFSDKHTLYVFASPPDAADLHRRLPYATGGPIVQIGGGIPKIVLREVLSTFEINSIKIDPIPFKHGETTTSGYRLGNFAYLIDGNFLSDESYAQLAGVELVVLNASSLKGNKAHFSFDTASDALERIRPKRAWFTHINHHSTHTEVEAWIEEAQQKRPGLKGIEIYPGYDGLVIDGIIV